MSVYDVPTGKLFRFTGADTPTGVYVARGSGWYGPRGGGLHHERRPDEVELVDDPAWTTVHENLYRAPARHVREQ